MRSVRALWMAVAAATLLPGIAAAQSGKTFKDAWFWGIKAGGLAYGEWQTSTEGTYKFAPTIGADWMITRTHGGLYVSYSQAFLTATEAAPASMNDTVGVPVKLSGFRRVDLAAVGFPGGNSRFRPYAGLGISLKQVAEANPQSAPTQYEASYIQSYRTGFSPLIMVGGQLRMASLSLFGQATASPAQKNMFLYGGKSFHLGYEIGLRYNTGSSIERE